MIPAVTENTDRLLIPGSLYQISTRLGVKSKLPITQVNCVMLGNVYLCSLSVFCDTRSKICFFLKGTNMNLGILEIFML